MSKEDFNKTIDTYYECYSKIQKLCYDYVVKNRIREDEEYNDFFQLDEDTLGLTFLDSSGDYSGLYTTVKIEDLIKE